MAINTDQIRQQVAEGLEMLKTVRDEIRVELHLAGMDARARWRELEPRFEEVERMAREVSDASRAAVEEALARLREFRDSLGRGAGAP